MFSNQTPRKNSNRHIFPQQQSELRPSRSKIQLTHLQNHPNAGDRSNYSSMNPPKAPQTSTNHEQSAYQSRIFQYQIPQGSSEFNNRLYNLMKEQIDIAAYNYRQKINQTIKIQAKEIQKLTAMLGYNHKMVQKQQEVVDKINQNQDHMSSTIRSQFPSRHQPRDASKSPRKISLTQNRSAKKLNQKRSISPLRSDQYQNQTLNLNMKALQRSLDQLDEKISTLNNRNKEMMYRVNQLEKLFGGETWRKIQRSEQILRKYISNNEGKLSTMETNSINRSTDIKQINSRLNNLTEEMKEMKELMFNLLHRQFNYDSYQVTNLKETLKKIQIKVNSINKEPKIMREPTIISHPQKTDKVKHQKIHHNTLMNHSYSMGHQAQYEADPLGNRLSQQQFSPSFNSVGSQQQYLDQAKSDESGDEFYFQDHKIEKNVRDSMLSQLQTTLRKNKSRFPVRVQIDGTGYLKEKATGIYILDQYDNGFDLTPQQIGILQSKGVIQL